MESDNCILVIGTPNLWMLQLGKIISY